MPSFIGRDKELEELYTMLEENRHVFLCGIAGMVKAKLPKPTQNITKSITLTFYM